MKKQELQQTLQESYVRPDVALLSLQEEQDGSVTLATQLEDGTCTTCTICAQDVQRIEQRAG